MCTFPHDDSPHWTFNKDSCIIPHCSSPCSLQCNSSILSEPSHYIFVLSPQLFPCCPPFANLWSLDPTCIPGTAIPFARGANSHLYSKAKDTGGSQSIPHATQSPNLSQTATVSEAKQPPTYASQWERIEQEEASR